MSVFIFDLDGTLVDTLDDLTDALNFALSNANKNNLSRDDVKKLIGRGINNLIIDSFNDCSANIIEIARKDFYYYYSLHYLDKTKPYYFAVDFINQIKENNYLCVLSNKDDDFTQKIVNKFFNCCFNVVFGHKPNFPIKPNKELVEYVLNNLILNGVDVDMNDIFYVGDSYIDYLTAINSNIPFLFIKHGYCKAEDIKRINTKYMFSDFRQLSEWYKNNKA